MNAKVEKQKVCVIGSGNGAFTVAAKLALAKYKVILWDREEFKENLNALGAEKRIYIEEEEDCQSVCLYQVTCNLEEAL